MSESALEELISLEGVATGYGSRRVLTDVNWQVRSGECWCLLGNNGAGKSTLIHFLLGQRRRMAGSVRFNPTLNGLNGVGFVPQRCDWNPLLPTTVAEFVSLGLTNLKYPRSERSDRIAEALDRVHLADHIERDYHQLSGGYKQRANVARALVRRPQLLILDEPTTGLDIVNQRSLSNVLESINRDQDVTIIVATHDLSLAKHLADHAAIAHEGKLQVGPADERLTDDVLAGVFGPAEGATE